MTLPPLLSELPPDTPLPWRVVHQGREYQGQVFLASSWQPGLESCAPEQDFCLVFLAHPQEVLAPPDPRVVVVVPGPRPRRALREVSAAQEAQLYARGRILARTALPVTPDQVFGLPQNEDRFNLLAQALIDRLERDYPFLGEAYKARQYLEGMELPPGELALDCASLKEQLTPDYLLKNPHLWESVKVLFDWLRSRYIPLYLEHHRRYQSEVGFFSK